LGRVHDVRGRGVGSLFGLRNGRIVGAGRLRRVVGRL
jgi:hypothetical protein